MGRKTYVSKDGYARFKDSDKLVHRYVAGKKYGEENIKGRPVHHIDGHKSNFDEENLLLLWDNGDHRNLEKWEHKRQFIGVTIILLGIVYFVSLLLVNFGSNGFLFTARLVVLIMIGLGIELRWNIFRQAITKPKENYFDKGNKEV